MINEKKLKEIQNIIDYKFKDLTILKNSLTHPSIFKKKEQNQLYNTNEYERLEFLGDRVLGLVVASIIFNKFKKINEGELTKKISFLVQRDFLFKIANKINLYKYIFFDSHKKSNAKLNKSILADTLESLIGAIFLDGGYQKSYLFIKKLWLPFIGKINSEDFDPKTKLQEFTQKYYNKLPEYILLKKEGPPHSPKFTVSLKVSKIETVNAKGNSIREAEKKAAKKVLKLVNEK